MVEPQSSLPLSLPSEKLGRVQRVLAVLGPDFTLFFAFLLLFIKRRHRNKR